MELVTVAQLQHYLNSIIRANKRLEKFDFTEKCWPDAFNHVTWAKLRTHG